MKGKETKNLVKQKKKIALGWQIALHSWGVLLDMALDEAWKWREEVKVL